MIMNLRKLEEDLIGLIEPVVAAEGMELWELTFRREAGGWILRVLIEKEDGITHEDCEIISRQVGDLLDVEDPIDRPYHLEISSPGMDRPLKKEAHFRRFVGSEAKITTRVSLEGQKHFKGKILEVKNGRIILEDRTRGAAEIPLDEVEKANLIPDLKW